MKIGIRKETQYPSERRAALTPEHVKKLVERARRIIMMFTHKSYEECAVILEEADGHVKTALVMSLGSLDKTSAQKLLNYHDGFIRSALESINQ